METGSAELIPTPFNRLVQHAKASVRSFAEINGHLLIENIVTDQEDNSFIISFTASRFFNDSHLNTLKLAIESHSLAQDYTVDGILPEEGVWKIIITKFESTTIRY